MKIILLLLVLISSNAFAQSSSRFNITRGVTAGGGTTISGGGRFQLASTIAQPLAAAPGSARFSIQGGFWIRPAPIVYAATKVGTNFVFSFQSDLGQRYVVQYVPSLTAANWQMATTVNGNGGVVTVTNPGAGSPQEYFRLLEP